MKHTSICRLLLLPGLLFTSSALRAEGVTSPAAIISSGSLTSSGSSHLEVFWGQVWARGDIRLNDLDVTVISPDPGPGPEPSIILEAGNKTYGAGIDYFNGQFPGKDEWLRWHCTGTFVESFDPVFPSAGIESVPVTDFFSQLMNGDFAGYNSANTLLTGRYTPLTVAGAEGILYDAAVAGIHPMGTGALVQNWPAVGTRIDDELTTKFSYSRWKQIAINDGYYLRPVSSSTGTTFTNEFGQLMYVRQSGDAPGALTTDPLGNTLLTDIGQISMKVLVPVGGNTHSIPDRVLFIDTIPGEENGTPGNLRITSSSEFFWKGMMYVAGNLEFAGAAGNPDVLMKNPTEYSWDPSENFTGTFVPSCVVEGVLLAAQDYSRTGNASVYGSFIILQSSTNSPPETFYNSRLTTDGISLPHTGSFISTQSGDWWDIDTWGGLGVPEEGSSVTISTGHYVVFHGNMEQIQNLTINGALAGSGLLGIRDGHLENNGTILTDFTYSPFSIFQFRFEGECTIVDNGGQIGLLDEFQFYNDDTPGSSTLVGDWNVNKVRIVNAALDVTNASLLVMDVTLFNESTVSGSPLYNGVSSLRYGGGNFIVGGEWPETDGHPYPPLTVGIDPDTTVTLDAESGDIYWLDNLTINAGGKLIGPGEGLLHVNGSLTNNGHLYITGSIRDGFGNYPAPITHGIPSAITTTQTLAGAGPVSFDYCDLSMDFTTIGSASSATVTAHHAVHPNAPASISNSGVYWDLESNGTGFSTTLTLGHAGMTDPYVCRYTGSGTSWIPARTQFDSTTVELDGITAFSTWAAGDAMLGPVPVTVSGWGVE